MSNMKAFVTAVTVTFTLAAQATALGINCRGSSNCDLVADARMTSIHDALTKQPQGDLWKSGDHIYCAGHFCAFYQNTGNQLHSTAEAAGHVENLLNHGCTVCGSDPLYDNNVSEGQLTVNFVLDS